jgi:prolipoprotein diacylglyceryltransferase
MSQVSTAKSKVSLFDIRNIIGALLFLYGVILLIVSFATSDAQKAKADGVNANLWVGLVLVVVGVFFVVWAVTRPIVVDEEQLERDRREVEEEARRRSRETGPAA